VRTPARPARAERARGAAAAGTQGKGGRMPPIHRPSRGFMTKRGRNICDRASAESRDCFVTHMRDGGLQNAKLVGPGRGRFAGPPKGLKYSAGPKHAVWVRTWTAAAVPTKNLVQDSYDTWRKTR